jgi:hypothetical protein
MGSRSRIWDNFTARNQRLQSSTKIGIYELKNKRIPSAWARKHTIYIEEIWN